MLAHIIAGIGIFILSIAASTWLLFPTQETYVAPNITPTATTTPVLEEPTKEDPPKKTEEPKKVAPPVTTPPPPPKQALPPQEPAPTQTEFEATATLLRSALVNIICTSGDPQIRSISGTGVVIDPKGVIATNTHIAQYFLLTGDPTFDVSCVIRSGSPARKAYLARPIFISGEWIARNAALFGTAHAKGTGEHDFAFLAITGSATSAPLPSYFAFTPLAMGNAEAEEPVVVGSYAAQFLTSAQIESYFYPTLVYGVVADIFTFGESSVDVVTLTGSAAAQEGSSGGGIARANGTLEAIISVSTIEGSTAERTLVGLTATYLRRAYEAESGKTLASLLSLSPAEAAAEFSTKIPDLRAQIVPYISEN
jgi:hypothetical protein